MHSFIEEIKFFDEINVDRSVQRMFFKIFFFVLCETLSVLRLEIGLQTCSVFDYSLRVSSPLLFVHFVLG